MNRGGVAGRLLGRVATGNSVVVVLLSFFSALVVGAVIVVVATPAALDAWGQVGSDPLGALGISLEAVGAAYGSLLSGALGSPGGLSETLVSTTPYLVGGLGVALAFRAGLFNIGGQGQLIAGAVAATWAGFQFQGLPIFVHLPLAILCGAAGGAAWGFIPGLLKAWTGAHEVITSMMLNYVGINLLTWLLSTHGFEAPPYNQAISKTVAAGARLPHLAGPSLRVNLGIVLGLLLALAVAWLLRQSTLGFEFRMIGLSLRAARVAGASVTRLTLVAMTLAGMLVGLAGTFMVLGVDYKMSPNYGGTFGFDAITVAILGRGTPLGVVLSALLFGAFQAGGRSMQVNTGIPLQLVEVLQAVIVLFVAAPGVIRTIYRIRVRGRGERVFGGWAA
jgi:simple sugar transport system permease protein